MTTRRTTLALGLCGAALLAASPAVAQQDKDPHNGQFTLAEATKDLKGSGKLTATIETTMGAFSCELFDKEAPGTVANFIGLARGLRSFRDPGTGQWRKGPFYDGLIFHRVIPGFMIQGGDITGKGSGSIGYEILDEKNAPHSFSKGGVLAMANRGPNTGTSQFFITEGPTPMLDDGGRSGGHYQIFGQCEPADLVKKIAAVPRNGMDRPNTEVKMTKVTISRAAGAAAPAGAKKADSSDGKAAKKSDSKPATKTLKTAKKSGASQG